MRQPCLRCIPARASHRRTPAGFKQQLFNTFCQSYSAPPVPPPHSSTAGPGAARGTRADPGTCSFRRSQVGGRGGGHSSGGVAERCDAGGREGHPSRPPRLQHRLYRGLYRVGGHPLTSPGPSGPGGAGRAAVVGCMMSLQVLGRRMGGNAWSNGVRRGLAAWPRAIQRCGRGETHALVMGQKEGHARSLCHRIAVRLSAGS